MSVSAGSGGRPRNLVLAAMIFAVAMTFIDQTIVSIAVPQIQRELGLSATGVQLPGRRRWRRWRGSGERPVRWVAAACSVVERSADR